MATSFPNIPVDQTVVRTTERNMAVARLGNGYEQRMPNGINYMRDKWSITWSGLNATDRDTLIAFLQSVSNGSVITWTSPFDVSQKKYCLEGDFTLQDIGGAVYSISCELRQVFDLT